MLGIQEACSSKAHVRVRSNWKTSGRETRNPINDAALAQSLIRRGFDEGRNSSTRRPANGVKRMIERMWSIGRIGEIILAPRRSGRLMRYTYRSTAMPVSIRITLAQQQTFEQIGRASCRER